MEISTDRVAFLIHITGQVQGVGFRPFVAGWARRLDLAGSVANDAAGVVVRVEGRHENIAQLRSRIEQSPPTSSRVERCEMESTDIRGDRSFTIDPSGPADRLSARVPRDMATCRSCLAEINDPIARRYHYPFTTCNDCGPRYSIIASLPYDRTKTSLSRFCMCNACAEEYRDSRDRRCHAQTIACEGCGPTVQFKDCDGHELAAGTEAVRQAAEAIGRGKIVALKGIGGFQLLCRADRWECIQELRFRKRRPTKPFALMVQDLDEARRLADVGPVEEALLESPENPIVLLERHPSPIAANVAPEVSTLGIMLPSTPLHHLLLDQLDCDIVVTSGNEGEDRIITDDDHLSTLADYILTHDRDIAVSLDDSLVRVIDDRTTIFRLARGYAPLPLRGIEQQFGSRNLPAVLALGGHQKVAIAFWNGRQAVLDGHIGDMNSPSTRTALAAAVRRLESLYQFTTQALVCDLHPDFFTTQWALEQGLATMRVQHHHAHAVAAMVEHNLVDSEVIALTWDGTGFGTDGTIWGGEILRCRADTYERVSTLRTFALPGREAAIHQPSRITLTILAQTLGVSAVLDNSELLTSLGFTAREAEVLLTMVERGLNTSWTSSLGRLFDAVAALLGSIRNVADEGEAPLWLESICDPSIHTHYSVVLEQPLPDRSCPQFSRFDWRPMLTEILHDLASGIAASTIATQFHNTIARWAATVARAAGDQPVVMGGGCFQNRLLTERTLAALRVSGARAFGPGLIPPGDGGLAAGQLAVALSRLQSSEGGG